MTSGASADERDAGPTTYAELLSNEFEFVRSIVRRAGVAEDEDAAQEILVRFWQLEMLEQYDPEYRIETDDGRPVRTRFRSFLGRFASLHALHHRDASVRYAKRREAMTDGTGQVRPAVAAALAEVDEYGQVEDADERASEVAKIARRVEEVDGPLEAIETLRHTRGQPHSQARTLKACMAIAGRGEPITRRALGEEMGVSDTAAGTFLQELRECVGAA